MLKMPHFTLCRTTLHLCHYLSHPPFDIADLSLVMMSPHDLAGIIAVTSTGHRNQLLLCPQSLYTSTFPIPCLSGTTQGD